MLFCRNGNRFSPDKAGETARFLATLLVESLALFAMIGSRVFYRIFEVKSIVMPVLYFSRKAGLFSSAKSTVRGLFSITFTYAIL